MSPIRTCVGCRRRAEQSELLRVVADLAPVQDPPPGGPRTGRRLRLDLSRRLPGRGAWLHPEPRCFEQAVRRRAFGRALRLSAEFSAQSVQAYVERFAEQVHETQDTQNLL
ncbi:MAG: YlxR family protein [Micrococcales bacterium]|nr:YlxR family protein [Micrococcales bacterium]